MSKSQAAFLASVTRYNKQHGARVRAASTEAFGWEARRGLPRSIRDTFSRATGL